MIRKVAVIGLMAAVLTGAAFGGQDPWLRQVRNQLAEATASMNLSGYTLTHGPTTNRLNHNRYRTHTLTLRAGVEYHILGVCDADCDDLDLTLFGPSGQRVAEDIELDDTPVVSVMPRHTGTYRLRVTMASCYDAPCRYGFAAYGY